MEYEKRLENVSVLGAAGKMGSGILLLTAVELADLGLKPENKGVTFVLNAIDVSHEGLAGVMQYLQGQVKKIAEKKTVQLRKAYAERSDLVENEEVINQYVFDVLNVVRPTTRMEAAYESSLVFEAVSENKDLKVKLLSDIDKNNPNSPWYFTNTSSVPIHMINEEAKLDGRILGFHFYNPPAVQKLVELIIPEGGVKEMEEFARAYAKSLRKVVVPSNDIAGFIGNGHFMRDALYGIRTAESLTGEMSLPEAIYAVNRVTQEYLVRPMGIFQLIDYVGIDVVQFIMKVMNPHMEGEDLHSDLLDKMMELGVKGGQYPSGAQKDGFFKYEGGKPLAVYDPEKKEYVDIGYFRENVDTWLGEMPSTVVSWRAALKTRNRDEVLGTFFDDLKESEARGAKLALEYGKKSHEIGEKLVDDGVANGIDDVNTVMLTGFFHAYGPVNNYFV